MNPEDSILADVLRPHWAQGLNDVSGNVEKGVSGWLAEGDYQIPSAPKSKNFVIGLGNMEPFVAALAADINRTAVAAYESIGHASRSTLFPKSTAWILIKSYYGAFFAGHAILRMLGTSFVNLEQPQADCINKIARLYGPVYEDVVPGNYVCSFSYANRETQWRRIDSRTGGVHEKFWAFFKERMDGLSKEVIGNKTVAALENQQVSVRLSELVANLCFDSCLKGNWLSVVRNRINYKHQFGAWYPYRSQSPSGTIEERLTKKWLGDPMAINLGSPNCETMRRFQETCSFIIGVCRVLALDMATRCSTGKSFHVYGWLAISRFAQQREARA